MRQPMKRARLTPGSLILRASGESDLGPEIEALFDGDVGKAALEWPEFKAAVDASWARRRSD